jgi:transketolase
MNDITALERKSRQIKATCVKMAFDGKVGHLGSALSCVEALVALYHTFLDVDPDNVLDPNRDRFILSKGHACTSLYAVLADKGFFPASQLEQYAVTDSPFPDHPCQHALPILECSSGSLGHGLGIATGMLYGMRLMNISSRAVVLMSDGECNEGSVWEAAMFAAAQKMDKLIALVDYNKIQAVGRSDEIMGFTSLEDKFRAFGWAARTIPGNDVISVVQALKETPFAPGKPTAIVLSTRKGSGVAFMEDQVLWHYRVPSNDDLNLALSELKEKPLY